MSSTGDPPASPSFPPGWYPDPSGGGWRWWDGTSWAAVPLYESPASVRIRRTLGWASSGTWTTFKGGPIIRVYADQILVGLAGRIARGLFPDYSFTPGRSSMRVENIGWIGTSINSRQCIVLATADSDTEVAFCPRQGRLVEAWEALRSVGVWPQSDPP